MGKTRKRPALTTRAGEFVFGQGQVPDGTGFVYRFRAKAKRAASAAPEDAMRENVAAAVFPHVSAALDAAIGGTATMRDEAANPKKPKRFSLKKIAKKRKARHTETPKSYFCEAPTRTRSIAHRANELFCSPRLESERLESERRVSVTPSAGNIFQSSWISYT